MTFVRFSGDVLTQGVQNLNLDGVPIRVYNPMKRIAGCLNGDHPLNFVGGIRTLRWFLPLGGS